MTGIQGVTVESIKEHTDQRGWLKELFRIDNSNIRPTMAYASHTKQGIVRGPHEHVFQSDFFVFIGQGDFELHLWDNRKDSATYTLYVKLIVGESNPVSVLIPPGVVHGYKAITPRGSFSLNFPNQLYAGVGKKGPVDEIRHEDDPKSMFKIK